MAELYRHTDEDGDTVTLETEAEGECSINIYGPNGYTYPQLAVYLPDAAGRRLLAALLSYYGPRSEEISEEKRRGYAQAKREATDD